MGEGRGLDSLDAVAALVLKNVQRPCDTAICINYAKHLHLYAADFFLRLPMHLVAFLYACVGVGALLAWGSSRTQVPGYPSPLTLRT